MQKLGPRRPQNNYSPLSDSSLRVMLALAASACVVAPVHHAQAAAANAATNSSANQLSTNQLSTTQADPGLGLMLEKGIISQEEMNKAQATLDARRDKLAAAMADENALPESKWLMSAGIKDMEIYGDIRLRYEDRQALDPGDIKNPDPGKHGAKYLPPGEIDLQRLRYALRFGVRGDAYDDFYYGFRMETSSNPRSSMVTMGTSSSGTPYQGPFGKSTAGVDVGQLFLGWKPESWVDVTFGRMANPLYTTPMVWSPSINPEGAAEHFKYKVGVAEFFANFGQFLYEDTNPNKDTSGYFSTLGYSGSDLPFLLAWQGGVDFHFTKNIDLKVAPVLYQYVGGAVDTSNTSDTPGFSNIFVGQGAVVGEAYTSGYNNGPYDGFYSDQTGINNLMVLEIPVELTVKLKKVDLRAFGDYAQNLQGAERARAAYAESHSPLLAQPGSAITPISSPQIHDNVAYQFGLAVASTDSLGLVNGATAKRHGWELRSYWQHVEQYSLDPNLLDLDFFEGDENLEGVFVAAAYGFTGNFIGTVRYGHAYRINSKLGTGGSGQDIPQMNPINEFNIFQADLTFKF